MVQRLEVEWAASWYLVFVSPINVYNDTSTGFPERQLSGSDDDPHDSDDGMVTSFTLTFSASADHTIHPSSSHDGAVS